MSWTCPRLAMKVRVLSTGGGARPIRQSESDGYDFKLSGGGVLSLREKASGRVIQCAPRTWATVNFAPPQPKKKGARRRIR